MPPNQEQQNTDIHQLETLSRLSPMGRRLFKFIEFDPSEQLLLEVRKHPIGLVWITIVGFGISLIVLTAMIIFARVIQNGLLNGGGVETTNASGIILLLGLVLSILGVIMTTILLSLYIRDVIFITDQKIAEVVYVSIFNRRTIQLNIGKVEDVAVTQVGLFPRIFNYGSLLIETAGETKNPVFPYVPDPYMVSKVIIQAHEEYVRKHGN